MDTLGLYLSRAYGGVLALRATFRPGSPRKSPQAHPFETPLLRTVSTSSAFLGNVFASHTPRGSTGCLASREILTGACILCNQSRPEFWFEVAAVMDACMPWPCLVEMGSGYKTCTLGINQVEGGF